MNYQSLTFIFFSAAVLLLYYIVGKKLQLWVLALANITFYCICGVKYLPFLLVTLFATYFSGLIIGHIYEKSDIKLAECTDASEKKTIRKKAKSKAKWALMLALIISIGLLAVCKYTGFAVTNINKLLVSLSIKELSTFNIILPIGISYYTFMAISYVLDIYWKRYKYEKNFLLYSVYLTYFPHIVQGPIDRFNEFKEQVSGGVKVSYENITFGAKLTIWGFFKKLVIADRLGMFVDAILGNWKNFDGIYIMIAFVVFSIQIYADFSGCIDIVSGVSEAFGIHLRKNFNHPYFSKTMAEFWRRWHISLQEWFKDYVYYPVSASKFTKSVKKGLKKRNLKRLEELFANCFPILVVWMITGIWHGAAWKFVAWGMFHASLLIGSRVFEPLFTKLTKLFHIDTENFGWHFLQMLRTFLLCCVGRIFFRAENFTTSLSLIKKMMFNTNITKLLDMKPSLFGLTIDDVTIMIASVCVLWIVDLLQEKFSIRNTLSKQNIVFRWAIILAGLFAIIIFGIYGPGYNASSFIYEQF